MSQGLKGLGGIPSFRFSANRVQPSELDQKLHYRVDNPSVVDTFLGTVTGAAAAAFVLDNVQMDYPRNLLFTMLGVAGGMGGTATVNGTDQFGGSINETLGFASANGGGTVAGTKIFNTITSGSVVGIAGAAGTAIGTAKLGVAIGTGTGIVALFGLPVKVKAVTDVKKIMWNDNAVMTAVNGGTVSSTYVGTANQTFTHGQIVAAADGVYVDILTTYDGAADSNLS